MRGGRGTAAAAALATALCCGCGYRLVDPSGLDGVTLGEVRNATEEPRLGALLEEALVRTGPLRRPGGRLLQVAVTRFVERVGAVADGGVPLRQEVSLELSWRLETAGGGDALFGTESVSRSYPYSADPVQLDWTRQAALRLLAEDAARAVADRLEGLR